jgi:hypothetical protein
MYRPNLQEQYLTEPFNYNAAPEPSKRFAGVEHFILGLRLTVKFEGAKYIMIFISNDGWEVRTSNGYTDGAGKLSYRDGASGNGWESAEAFMKAILPLSKWELVG